MRILAQATAQPGVAPAALAAVSRRDLRLDFFRGLSLFFIFIDHIPQNVLSYFTLHAIAFCDAAEVFIFISGYTAALVYGQSLRRNGALYATAQIYRRVWQLYVAHVFLFVIFTAEVSYATLAAQNPMYSEELGVGNFLAEPHLAIIHALLLDFQPALLNILPLYIVLLGTFPLVLLGLDRNRTITCGISAVIYVLTLTRGWSFHTFPDNTAWFFNPLAWQFLFVIGAALGKAHAGGREPRGIPRWLTLGALIVAVAIALTSLTWMAHFFYAPSPPIFERLWPLTLDKTDLAPLRLFGFLAVAGAALHLVRPNAGFLAWRPARLVILCGQNSLYVFCLGILLSVLGHFLLSEINARVGMQIVVNVAGAAMMVGMALVLQWYKTANRRRAAVAAGPSAASE